MRRRLAAGDDPNHHDKRGMTPLHFACQERAYEAAVLLLEHGVTVDAVDRFGNTPLSTAVFHSRGEGNLIALLRGKGADPYRMNNHGQTPVGLARLIANYPIAQFFADLPA